MTTWKVSTQEKKSVTEIEIWQKEDKKIQRVTGFRWGSVFVTTDDDDDECEPPELEQSEGPDDNAVNMYDCGYDTELDCLDDGVYSDFIFSDNMSEEEKERMLEIWDEEPYSSWENDGWYNVETECWFSGPLDIEKVD